MRADIETFKDLSDARLLLDLLIKHRAPASAFRLIAANLAAEVLPLAEDERSVAAVESARAFALGKATAETLEAAHRDANVAFRTSTSGVLALARVAAVNASSAMATPAGPALAAQSAAARAFESARFAGAEGLVVLKQADALRGAFTLEMFEALVERAGAEETSHEK